MPTVMPEKIGTLLCSDNIQLPQLQVSYYIFNRIFLMTIQMREARV